MAYATPEELAEALHTRLTAQNQANLQACVDAASKEADHWIDWQPQVNPLIVEETPAGDAALLHVVVLARAVEWAKANDAAFGIIGYADIGALRAPKDGFNRHAYALLPLKQGFGLA